MLNGFTSTLSDGATAWMAANWPVPEAMAGSRRTAARVTRGAICLSSSSHFPLMLYSKFMKPVALPPGRARLSTKPAADRIGDNREHDRHGAGRLQQWPHGRAARGQDDVRRERDQFRRVSANVAGTGPWPSGCRSARCGRWSSPTAPAPAGTLRRGPDLLGRPRSLAGARRCAAPCPAAARAPQPARAAASSPSRRGA